jgi:cytoskeletal protein RodZ
MVSERRAFGERLRRQRERRGVTLASISTSSKVPASLYEALERGDCSRWPAGLYARAYLRSYAEAVGLNANETVEEFAGIFGETPTTHNEALLAAARVPSASRLRLSIAPEPALQPELIAKRAALAAADLLIGFLIAAVAYVGLGAGVWITVACALAYHAVGRVVSNEPLLYWMYQRTRAVPATTSPEGEPQNVAVGDAASTAA